MPLSAHKLALPTFSESIFNNYNNNINNGTRIDEADQSPSKNMLMCLEKMAVKRKYTK